MTDSADDMPPALRSMWRSLRLAHRAEPRLMSVSFALSLFSAVPDALFALWIKLLADGVAQRASMLIAVAAIGLGISTTATWFLDVVSTRVQRRFRDRVTIALEAHVARLQASIASIEHHERPEYLDRLAMLRNQVFVLDHMYVSLFSTCGWLLRLAIAVGLLASVHPLLSLLVLFALPTVVSSSLRPAAEQRAEQRAAAHGRLARHLFMTATSAAPGKEVRITGIGERLAERALREFARWYDEVATARSVSARWHAAAWTLFGLGYVAAVVLVATAATPNPGGVLLVLAAGARLSAYVGAAVGEIGFLRGFWLEGARRMAWLEDYAASRVRQADLAAPSRLARGIRFEGVSFAYPGSERRVLQDVNLELPSGGVVAIVGENGAGKTTLVKLLAKLYEPTTGRIWVDDLPLARIAPEAWRARLSGAFQDFFRFELSTQHSVGLGDVPRREDRPAVIRAIERAGADDVVAQLRSGLDTQLGPSWPDGVDVSFGQWQKLALGRGFMREQPLLLLLDEPTAALDAETEHALFERYAQAARAGAEDGGRITVLISHRFSTVRMADLIVVMDGARIAEVGTHQQLIANAGQYAQLYDIQAASYA